MGDEDELEDVSPTARDGYSPYTFNKSYNWEAGDQTYKLEIGHTVPEGRVHRLIVNVICRDITEE